MASIIYGGLDVHQKSIQVELLVRDTGEVLREEVVNERLHRKMVQAFGKMRSIAETRKVPLRTAAFVLAIGRVASATSKLGIS